MMGLLEEINKAAAGDPDAKVVLAPMAPEEIAVEEKLKAKGYRFAFGNGWASRKDFVESLPWICDEDDRPGALDEAIAHCEDVILDESNCPECRDQHKQLANWLIELRNRRAARE